MDATPDNTGNGTPSPTATAAQAAEKLQTTVASADAFVSQGIHNLQLVHQARLSQANRAVAALTAEYGADDPRVKTAQASVTATKTTIARATLVRQQLAVPAVQVSKSGWALQGYVGYLKNAEWQPAAKFTVYLVDSNNAFLRHYGFTYTDDTGYFLLNYAGDSGQPAQSEGASSLQLFIGVANQDAKPVYPPRAFKPVTGALSFQNIILPEGGQPLGDPPGVIREIAVPGKDTSQQASEKRPSEVF